MNSSIQNKLLTPNPDDIDIDIEPFIVTSEHDQTLADFKESEEKTFTLRDYTGKKIVFVKAVLGLKHNNFKKLKMVKNDEGYKLYVEVTRNSLDAVESNIYKDALHPSASVGFKDTFTF